MMYIIMQKENVFDKNQERNVTYTYCVQSRKILYSCILGCFLFPKLTVEENTGSNMILQDIKLFSKKKIFTHRLM